MLVTRNLLKRCIAHWLNEKVNKNWHLSNLLNNQQLNLDFWHHFEYSTTQTFKIFKKKKSLVENPTLLNRKYLLDNDDNRSVH